MRPFPVDQLAIWMPIKVDGLDVRVYNEGYPYQKAGIILRSNLVHPVHRYAKNYSRRKKHFSLCIISEENDTTQMEAWLDAQAKKVKLKDIGNDFKMVEIHYGHTARQYEPKSNR